MSVNGNIARTILLVDDDVMVMFTAGQAGKASEREALERIPVKVVEHGQLGVIGAASWYLGRTDV